MRTLIFSLLSLALAVTASTTVSGKSGSGNTIPVKGRGELTFTSITVDPSTGFVLITGDVVVNGTFGKATGTDTYTIDPISGSYTGAGTRTSADGSTYTVSYQGQFINATDSVGTYTANPGTGRFARIMGSGTFTASRWVNGLGSSSVITGTATFLDK